VIIAAITGLIFVSITPPFWGIDETSHFARVYQLAHGQVLPHTNRGETGIAIPANLDQLFTYTKSDLLDNSNSFFPRHDVDSVEGYNRLTSQKFSKNNVQYIWAATYSPVAYVGAVVGTIFADILNLSIGHTLFLARFFTLATYVIIVGFSLKILSRFKIKWLFFSVALLPVCIFQASVVTADNIAIALSILFMALFIRLKIGEKEEAVDRWLGGLLLAVAIMLPLVKINYILLSFAVLAIPSSRFGKKHIYRFIKPLAVILSVAGAILWNQAVKVVASSASSVSQRPDGARVDPVGQIGFIIHNPMHFLVSCFETIMRDIDSYVTSITSVGWNFVTIPVVFTFLIILGLFFAALYAKEELLTIRKELALLFCLSVAGIASVYAVLYVTFNSVGSLLIYGVQGRYFLPFIIPLLLFLALIVPVGVKVKGETFAKLIVGCSSFGLLITLAYFYFLTY